jgi:hypothetical protein
MRLRVLVLFAVIAFAGVASAVALGRHSRALSCTSTDGAVNGSYPTARLGCTGTSFSVGRQIYRTETETTSSSGLLIFHTDYLYRCTESSNSALVVAPSASVALQYVRGTTFCRHLQTSVQQTLNAGHTQIRITGTIVGVSIGDNGTLVQLPEGSAIVTAGGQTRKVPQDQQVLVSSAGVPGTPTALVLAPTDQVTVTELQLDVVPMATSVVPQHLHSRSETSAVIVAQDAATGKRLAAQLKGFKTSVLTAAQVTANPSVVTAALKPIAANSIVTAGTTDSMVPVWTAIRTKASIPATAAVVYALP